jgi:2-phosphosulfolactate phosphatase
MTITLEVDSLPRSGSHDVVVVIDVLRMTTTASVLLDGGLRELLVVADVDEARRVSVAHQALLLGERDEQALPGFDGGNSPLEYAHRDFSGEVAVVCTSNGSKAVEAAASAQHLLLGSIVNAAAVATRALELAQDRITLSCAGTAGQLSLDDMLGAACIAHEIVQRAPDLQLTDSAMLVLKLLTASAALDEELAQAKHGKRLVEIGFFDDIRFAAQRNAISAVPERRGSNPARFT